MKLLIIYITVLLSCLAFAQDKNPSVELPDFVITGKDVISVRRVDKIPPDLVSAVSEEYLKPLIKPEELEVTDISNPVERDLSLLDSAGYHRGLISVESGRYKLPAGEINYTFPFERGMLHGIVRGLNQLEYVNNSDKQSLFGSLVFNYSLPVYGQFLPGTKFALSGNHEKNYYKFFGSDKPDFKRVLNSGKANLGIQNLYMKQFIFDVNFGGDFTYLEDEVFNESIFYSNAFGRFQTGSLGLNIKFNYQNQSLKTDSLSNVSSDFIFARPSVSLELFDIVRADLGFTYETSDGRNFNSLFAAFGLQVAENTVLLAEFSPQAEFITAGNLIGENFYFNQQDIVNIFLKKKNKFKAVLKYEYDKYYQLDGGVEYYKAENLPYYVNSTQSGFFNINVIDATSLDFFLNLIYHMGPYGIFYASFEYIKIEDLNDRKIPYYPNLKASLSYGYDFKNGLLGELLLKYYSDRFADLENTIKLNGFFNLGFKLTYLLREQFSITLKIENILNSERYLWEGYQEKPLDAAIGFNFFFD